MTGGFGRFLRQNTIALIALFFALAGTTFAAANALPKNSVGTKQIKNNAVTSAKIKNNQVTGADVKESSLGQVPSAAHASSADNATHAVSADSAPPSGAAGGALSGTYPNPGIAAAAIGGGHLKAITERSADSTPIPAGTGGSATVQCNAGERVISGGNDGFVTGPYVVASRFEAPNGWTVFGFNATGSTLSITVHAYCLAP